VTRFAKSIAALLALLILSPFTAPFSPYPLASISAGGSHSTATRPGVNPSEHALQQSGSTSGAVEEQFKDDAVLADHGVTAVVATVTFRDDAPVVTGPSAPRAIRLALRV